MTKAADGPELSLALIQAVLKADQGRVKELINAGVDPTDALIHAARLTEGEAVGKQRPARRVRERFSLADLKAHQASEKTLQVKGHPAVRALIEKAGADPTAALSRAANRGDYQAIDGLIRAGADVNAMDSKGAPLLMLVLRKQVERQVNRATGEAVDLDKSMDAIAVKLIEAGAHVAGVDGERALFYSISKGYEGAAKAIAIKRADDLVKGGACYRLGQGDDPESFEYWPAKNQSLTKWARKYKRREVVDILDEAMLKTGDPTNIDRLLGEGAKPDALLLLAAQGGHLDAVQYLVKTKGADVAAKAGNGDTPASLALINGHKAVRAFLLKNNKPVDIKPLIRAAASGDLQSVLKQIPLGAPVDKVDPNGVSALQEAVLHGHGDVVEALIVNGAQVDKKAERGYTALDQVAQADEDRYKEVIKVLVVNGARISDFTVSGASENRLVKKLCGMKGAMDLKSVQSMLSDADDAKAIKTVMWEALDAKFDYDGNKKDPDRFKAFRSAYDQLSPADKAKAKNILDKMPVLHGNFSIFRGLRRYWAPHSLSNAIYKLPTSAVDQVAKRSGSDLSGGK